MKLHTVIDSLPNYGTIDPVRKANWKRLKDVRDALFHAGRVPSDKERADLLEEIMRLEKDVAAKEADFWESVR